MSIWRTYKLTPPEGKEFYLAIGDNGKMVTTRSGAWAKDELFDGTTVSAADILNPQYLLSEFDVVQVQPDQIPSMKETA